MEWIQPKTNKLERPNDQLIWDWYKENNLGTRKKILNLKTFPDLLLTNGNNGIGFMLLSKDNCLNIVKGKCQKNSQM